MTFNTAYNRIALRTVLLFITVSASAYLLVKQWYVALDLNNSPAYLPADRIVQVPEKNAG
jgi:hypothetical protein